MEQATAAVELKKTVRLTLGECLGAYPPWSRPTIARKAHLPEPQPAITWAHNLGWAILFGFVFALAFWLVPFVVDRLSNAHLYNAEMSRLALYGGLWFWWASWTSRVTSHRIELKLTKIIVEHLPDNVAKSINDDIATSWHLRHASCLSFGIALVLVGIAVLSVRDVLNINVVSWTCVGGIWWGLGWLLIFYVAARGIIVGTFYYTFSKHLNDALCVIYPYDPGRSAVVEDLSSVGRTMVPFWFGIAFSILCVIPFIIAPEDFSGILELIAQQGVYKFGANLHVENRAYLYYIVPITIFGALVPGTIVFLLSEGAIERAVETVRRSSMCELEKKARCLLVGDRPAQDEIEIRERLAGLHDRLANGRYRNVGVRALSVIAPFTGVIATGVGLLLK
jgi:hypothetical protein